MSDNAARILRDRISPDRLVRNLTVLLITQGMPATAGSQVALSCMCDESSAFCGCVVLYTPCFSNGAYEPISAVTTLGPSTPRPMPKHTFVRNSLLAAVALACAACRHAAAPAGSAASAPAARTAAAPPAPKTPALPAGVTTAMIAEGDSIFNTASCQRCHGKGAVGATNGPSLVRTTWDHGSGRYEDIVKTIIAGVPKDQMKDPARPFAMRARGGVQPALTDPQVNAVAAYIWSLNHPTR